LVSKYQDNKLILSLAELKERFKDIRLIVSDIDGTLVSGSNQISAQTIDLVEKIKKKTFTFH